MHEIFKFVFLITFIGYVTNVYGANILYVAPVASRSHHIWNKALAVGLAQEGHNVTYISPNAEKLSNKTNYPVFIHFEDVYKTLYEEIDVNGMAEYGPYEMIYALFDYINVQNTAISKSNGLRTLLNYPETFKFDLIIFDVSLGSCMLPIIERFKYPPAVGVTPFLLPPYVSFNFGNNVLPSYLPWYSLPFNSKMNFRERLINFVSTYLDLYLTWRESSNEQQLSSAIFGQNIPPLSELFEHISIVLANTDPILDYPQPLPPNIIPVGGLHTKSKQKIPEDLQKLLDSANNGIVVFSLGSNVRSDKLDKNTQKALLEAFSEIPQLVVWKFESEIENLPKNVRVMKWLPQNDILGHPNVRLFIGHGGAMSTQEAVYHGVPMIGVPFMADQFMNIEKIVNQKLGVKVDFRLINKSYFLQKLREVLDKPIYAKNAKAKSAEFRDRPETPLERAIFWIEYVLRHKGAKFLSPQARHMSFLQTTSYDVIAFLLFSVVVTLFLVCKLLFTVYGLFRTKNKLKTN